MERTNKKKAERKRNIKRPIKKDNKKNVPQVTLNLHHPMTHLPRH